MSASDLERRLSTFFTPPRPRRSPTGSWTTYRVTRPMPQRKGPAARRTAALAAWWSNPFGSAPGLRVLAVAVFLLVALTASLVYVAGHYRRLPPPYGPAGTGCSCTTWTSTCTSSTTTARAGGWRSASAAAGGRCSRPMAPASPSRRRPRIGRRRSSGSPTPTGAMPDRSRRRRADRQLGLHVVSRQQAHRVCVRRGWGKFVALCGRGGRLRLRRITKDDGADRTYPTWSPRGDLIAYRLVPATQDEARLAVISPEGDGEQWLVTAMRSEAPSRGRSGRSTAPGSRTSGIRRT